VVGLHAAWRTPMKPVSHWCQPLTALFPGFLARGQTSSGTPPTTLSEAFGEGLSQGRHRRHFPRVFGKGSVKPDPCQHPMKNWRTPSPSASPCTTLPGRMSPHHHPPWCTFSFKVAFYLREEFTALSPSLSHIITFI
jgi:hypothetical protein